MSVKTETRTQTSRPELRAAATGAGRVLFGYAAVFNVPTLIADSWIETLKPGCFSRSINDDICAIIGHDRTRVIGRVGAGTLRLSEDAHGLAYEIDLPDTSDGRDLAVSVDRGDISGMSFGFMADRQIWDDIASPPERTIFEAKLLEVTVTAFPAYPDTTIGLRSLDEARKERRQHNFSAAARRLRMKATADLRERAGGE